MCVRGIQRLANIERWELYIASGEKMVIIKEIGYASVKEILITVVKVPTPVKGAKLLLPFFSIIRGNLYFFEKIHQTNVNLMRR